MVKGRSELRVLSVGPKDISQEVFAQVGRRVALLALDDVLSQGRLFLRDLFGEGRAHVALQGVSPTLRIVRI